MSNAIGIDIGGTKIRAARIAADGTIQDSAVLATGQSPAAVIAQIEALFGKFADARTLATGIGVPGRVDASTGRILSGGFVNLSGELTAGLRGAVRNAPVFFDNDASMALFGEARLGAAAGLSHIVMLTIGTGIGGALMLDGRIVHGRGTAGQLGHITVDVHGRDCLCGRTGCLETFSSGTALRACIAASGLEIATTLEHLLANRDARSQAVLERWTKPLRAGIDSLVAAFDPQIVVLGGGLGAAACEALLDFPAGSPWYQCPVVPAALGDTAGMVGAALAALERLR